MAQCNQLTPLPYNGLIATVEDYLKLKIVHSLLSLAEMKPHASGSNESPSGKENDWRVNS